MSDYIDREKVLKLVAESGKYSLMAMIADPEIIPSADVRENIHGEWIAITQPWVDTQIFKCTCCGRHIEIPQYEVSTLTIRYPFCHCGADMRGENGM